MREEEIRSYIQKIQEKYYTPTAKIAKAIGVDSSLVNKFIHQKIEPSDRLLKLLEAWVSERI